VSDCALILGLENSTPTLHAWTNMKTRDECGDRRRAAGFTIRLASFIRCLMNTVPHDFVTVDMRGLKAALVARARRERVSVSVLVRKALARDLGLFS
jgi:hypothetical protein